MSEKAAQVAKLRAPTEEIQSRIRELTAELRQLRRDLADSTNARIAKNGMADDKASPRVHRGRKPSDVK